MTPANPIVPPPVQDVARLIDWALREDGAGSDVTSDVVVPADATGDHQLVARQTGVFAGRAILTGFETGFSRDGLVVHCDTADGAKISPGQVLAVLSGPRRLVLRIERPLLNFLQRLCGVATETHRFVDAVAGTRATILDTRKTLPGWRELDKYAVRCGGGANHRMGLHDAVLVKDNHFAGVPVDRLGGLVADWVARARRHDPAPAFVEIEVDSLDQFAEVLAAKPDRILLDNFSPDQIRRAVAMRDATRESAVALEASGGIDLATVRSVAETGVDFISVGSLTHSAAALDLALDAS